MTKKHKCKQKPNTMCPNANKDGTCKKGMIAVPELRTKEQIREQLELHNLESEEGQAWLRGMAWGLGFLYLSDFNFWLSCSEEKIGTKFEIVGKFVPTKREGQPLDPLFLPATDPTLTSNDTL